MNNVTLGGADPRSGRRVRVLRDDRRRHGRPPRPAPGISGVHTHMSNTRNTPVEAIEHYLPVRIRHYALRADSGGAGRCRGGDGIVREYECCADAAVTVLSERRAGATLRRAGRLARRAAAATPLIRDGVERNAAGQDRSFTCAPATGCASKRRAAAATGRSDECNRTDRRSKVSTTATAGGARRLRRRGGRWWRRRSAGCSTRST